MLYIKTFQLITVLNNINNNFLYILKYLVKASFLMFYFFSFMIYSIDKRNFYSLIIKLFINNTYCLKKILLEVSLFIKKIIIAKVVDYKIYIF